MKSYSKLKLIYIYVTLRLSEPFLKKLLIKSDKQDITLLKTRLPKIQYSKNFPKQVHKLSKSMTRFKTLSITRQSLSHSQKYLQTFKISQICKQHLKNQKSISHKSGYMCIAQQHFMAHWLSFSSPLPDVEHLYSNPQL